jgi:transcriptional regulator with GAF, ATPase, and Fis domain
MVTVPAWEELAALAREMESIAPVTAIGFVRGLEDSRASVLCAFPQGVVHCTVATTELPAVLSPHGAELREIEPRTIEAGGNSGDWFLELTGAHRVVSMGIPGRIPAARLWMAAACPEPFTPGQAAGFRTAALSGGRLLDVPASPGEVMDRLTRLDQSGELLSALLRVLDVREVLDRVSEAARHSLPHDVLRLNLYSDDLARIEVAASTDGGSGAGQPPAQVLSPALARLWDFDIVADHRHPLAIQGLSGRPDACSSLRMVMRFNERVIGDLTFLAREPHQFTGADVAVGRRLADHAAMALSHHRLAEESRRATALQERATNLEVLDGLLATLTGVLDVREVFDRVSAIAQKVLPHDAMSISEIIENGAKIRIHASHGLGRLSEPFDLEVPDPTMVTERWDYRLLDDVRNHREFAKGPGWGAGMRSMLFVSIRLEGRNYGGLNFYSRSAGHFVRDDVLVARRITDHVALALSHRRLADEARKSEELRARTTSLELLDDLLTALPDTEDLRDVMAKVSGVVRRVLAHDAAALIMRLPDTGQSRVFATCGFPANSPESAPVPDGLLTRTDWEHDIIDNLTREAAPLYAHLSGLGFRSLLRIPIRMDGRFTGALALLATGHGSFKASDVFVARRMADRLTVAIARDREIAASARADEATARAARLEARVKSLTEELDARTGYRRVIGDSAPWRRVLTQAAQVAATETTVLLLGESGTGKEVIARFLHRGSSRKGGPFIALNCAALPEQLLEAELFGYERGAYTGATQSKPGQLEQAFGGTLFLDEVAEMSPTAQPKFLRVLQEREFQRLGGTRVLRTDARIVAATNRDLKRSITDGDFREDLYYRLNVFTIQLPPLRERREDILPLSEAFIAEIGGGLGRPPAGISRDARQALLDYTWPGNIRELRNVLERAAILCDGGLITADLLGLTLTPGALPVAAAAAPMPSAGAGSPPSAEVAVDGMVDGDLQSMERVLIQRALENARFNKSKAAKALGLTRHQLYIRLRKHGFE